MSSAFSIALSALESNSEGIDTAGNNLANMNTTGFKQSQVDFKDLFSESLGGGASSQVGLGVRVLTQQIFSQGSIETSQSSLASAIQGDGFYVVTGANNQSLFTRDGNFAVTAAGVLQTQTGENVQGWMATSTGINTTGAPGNITVPVGELLAPVATTNFSVSANLNSSGVSGTATGALSTPMSVVDSLGNTHDLTITFTKSSTSANSWSYDITIPGADVNGGTPGQQQSVLTNPGTLTFNSDGTLSTAGGTAPVPVTISGLSDGAATLNMNWNLFDSTGAGSITQYADTSSTSSSTQDGTQAAQFTSVGISDGGTVVATFSTGQTKVEAQLAMAGIQNPDSLKNVGNNDYAASGNTATPAIGTPDSGGRGQILGGSLESSNVDMAAEFTNLIVYQSGYQASSRVISTEQTIFQDLFSLIH